MMIYYGREKNMKKTKHLKEIEDKMLANLQVVFQKNPSILT